MSTRGHEGHQPCSNHRPESSESCESAPQRIHHHRSELPTVLAPAEPVEQKNKKKAQGYAVNSFFHLDESMRKVKICRYLFYYYFLVYI